ncbi:hypothetical protein LguiB_024538 [Lonicera macranthoides]
MASYCVGVITNQGGGGLVSVPNCYNAKTIAKHSSSSVSSLVIPCSTSYKLRFPWISKVGHHTQGLVVVRASSSPAETIGTEKFGIKILNNPPESKLVDLDVRSWPKWGCPPSKFPWTYSAKETCYLLKGKVKVYPDGSEEAVEIGAGDLVEFPEGMKCTWDVSETVEKHYNFE